MTSYVREFMGIPAEESPPGRLDPNYRDGYHGLRMKSGPGQAAYGAYRFAHRADLGSAGGFEGVHGEDRPRRRLPPPDAAEKSGIPEGRDGGVRSLGDPEFLRDFDSRGIRYSADDSERG
jgi:hypothetical protein